VRFDEPYQKSLLFSPDDSMIAILFDQVVFRDLSTGKQVKTLESGLDPFLDFVGFDRGGSGAIGAFSPNGKILASTWLVATSDDKLRREPKGVITLWDVLSGEKIAMLDGHSSPILGEYSNPITALAFSSDGNLLVSGAKDNTIIVWDAQSGSLLKVLQGHTGAISSLAFSPDDKLLYSGSLDGTVIIWNIEQLLP
jgi:WD40 repeat protein